MSERTWTTNYWLLDEVFLNRPRQRGHSDWMYGLLKGENNMPDNDQTITVGGLLAQLSRVADRISNAEARAAQAKADRKAASKMRDEILAQLEELDVVVEGV